MHSHLEPKILPVATARPVGDLPARRHSRAQPAHRTRRFIIRVYAAAALALLPWSVLLATHLPQRHLSAHWDIAWAGFDLALAGALMLVAVTAWRRSLWLEGTATAAAALLACDAWFDLLTATSRRELILAGVEAALVELPLALLCLWVARRANSYWLRASRLEEAPASDGILTKSVNRGDRRVVAAVRGDPRRS